jgi:hypothetical protein
MEIALCGIGCETPRNEGPTAKRDRAREVYLADADSEGVDTSWRSRSFHHCWCGNADDNPWADRVAGIEDRRSVVRGSTCPVSGSGSVPAATRKRRFAAGSMRLSVREQHANGLLRDGPAVVVLGAIFRGNDWFACPLV